MYSVTISFCAFALLSMQISQSEKLNQATVTCSHCLISQREKNSRFVIRRWNVQVIEFLIYDEDEDQFGRLLYLFDEPPQFLTIHEMRANTWYLRFWNLLVFIIRFELLKLAIQTIQLHIRAHFLPFHFISKFCKTLKLAFLGFWPSIAQELLHSLLLMTHTMTCIPISLL